MKNSHCEKCGCELEEWEWYMCSPCFRRWWALEQNRPIEDE